MTQIATNLPLTEAVKLLQESPETRVMQCDGVDDEMAYIIDNANYAIVMQCDVAGNKCRRSIDEFGKFLRYVFSVAELTEPLWTVFEVEGIE